MSGLYQQLCDVGEIKYLVWKEEFKCSKDEYAGKKLLNNINETCDTMENELKLWKETINAKRQNCYFLNHFTMKQILNLRKELANAGTGQVAVDQLPLQTFILLETVNESVDPLLLADVLKTMIPDNSIFLTEECFKDGQKYFANDVEGESILEENVEDEIGVTHSSQLGFQMNSFDTYISAKEALESMSSMEINTEDYLLAAFQDCGGSATIDELVAWVVSHENDDEETVMTLCEEAKNDPHLSDLVKEVFGLECQITIGEEEFLNSETEQKRYCIAVLKFIY